MGLTAKSQGERTFDPIPEGTHQMVCYGVVDEGTQYSKTWDKESYKVRVFWECQEERIDIEKDGETKSLPRVISKQYTLSLHPKSRLHGDLVSWRGKQFTPEELDGFDLSDLIGANCLIQIVHNTNGDKTYANIASIAKLMKGMDRKNPESETFVYDIQRNGIDIPETVPDWVKGIIRESPEFKMVAKNQDNPVLQDAVNSVMDDEDIPF